MRVCQFRHDGNRIYLAAAALEPPNQEDQPFYFTDTPQPVKPRCEESSPAAPEILALRPLRFQPYPVNPVPLGGYEFRTRARRSPKDYASFAVIEIFAFSTFDTGQPFSAASAYF